MERIQQALDKAEKDRATARGKGRPEEASGRQGQDGDPAATHQIATDVQYSRTRTLGVPESVLLKNRVVAGLPQHPHHDAYRMLRTRVLQCLRANSWNSFAVTSPATGSGKTLTAINLAVSLAMEVVHTVLLVDLDLRNPSIHRYFDYEPEYGLSDYLFNDVPIEQILFSPSIDRLVVLPGKDGIRNSSEMLRSPKMVGLVEELKNRYPDRLVVFDLPPMLAADDALAFSPYTDSMLMVAENGATTSDDLDRAISVLKGTPIIGTVLNKAEASGS